MKVLGFPRGAAESTDRKPGTRRLTRTSSGEAGAQRASCPGLSGRRPEQLSAPSRGHRERPPRPTPASAPGRRQGGGGGLPQGEADTLWGWNLLFGPSLPPPTPPPPSQRPGGNSEGTFQRAFAGRVWKWNKSLCKSASERLPPPSPARARL